MFLEKPTIVSRLNSQIQVAFIHFHIPYRIVNSASEAEELAGQEGELC